MMIWRMSPLNVWHPSCFNKTTVKFSCCLVGRMAGLFRDKGHQCQNFDTFLVLTWPLCCSVKDNIHECWIFGTPFLTNVNFWGCLVRRMTGLFRDNRHQIHYKALVICHSLFVSNEQLFPGKVTFELSATLLFETWPLWTSEVAW